MSSANAPRQERLPHSRGRKKTDASGPRSEGMKWSELLWGRQITRVSGVPGCVRAGRSSTESVSFKAIHFPARFSEHGHTSESPWKLLERSTRPPRPRLSRHLPVLCSGTCRIWCVLQSPCCGLVDFNQAFHSFSGGSTCPNRRLHSSPGCKSKCRNLTFKLIKVKGRGRGGHLGP